MKAIHLANEQYWSTDPEYNAIARFPNETRKVSDGFSSTAWFYADKSKVREPICNAGAPDTGYAMESQIRSLLDMFVAFPRRFCYAVQGPEVCTLQAVSVSYPGIGAAAH